MISLFGTSSIFASSLGTHTFGYSGRRLKPTISISENSKKSFTNKEVNEEKLVRKVESTSNPNTLTKNHFENWRFQCEGATEEIYLVTKENRVLKIPAKNYGQKQRRMVDGVKIDEDNPCFGFRSLIHQQDSVNGKITNKMEKVQKFFKLFSTSDEREFKKLGDWWKELKDNDKCEVIEIISECDYFKKQLGGGTKEVKTIQEGLNLSFEKIIPLSRQKEFKAPKISDFWGNGKIIYLPKIGNFASLIGGVVDEWSEEYINGKYEETEKGGGVNGFALLEKLIKGEQAYKACSNNENTPFYDECNQEINVHLENEKTPFKEEWTIPKVVGVVKGGTIYKDDIVVSTGTMKNKAEAIPKLIHETRGENQEQIKKYIESFKDKGRKDGIVDIRCKRFQYYSYWWNFIKQSLDEIKRAGCQLAWDLIFPRPAHEKRWCLFEIPQGKSYLREYNLSFLRFSYWWKNSKFWAHCSDFGLWKLEHVNK